jgi:hypothetical protein
MFDLSKIFDLSKKFAPPDTLLKSKNYCTRNQDPRVMQGIFSEVGGCPMLSRKTFATNSLKQSF